MLKNERRGRKVRHMEEKSDICHSFTAFKTSYKISSKQYKSIMRKNCQNILKWLLEKYIDKAI